MATTHPTVVLLTGPPGTGKSTLAEASAAALGAPVLGWDWAMAGLTWCEPVQAALRALEAVEYRRVGWAVLVNLAEAQLRQGRSVVLDGVARDDEVALVRDLAARTGARAVVVLTSCADADVLRRRVTERRREIPGWHELTWDHVESFFSRWRPPADVDATVDTTGDPDPDAVVARVLAP